MNNLERLTQVALGLPAESLAVVMYEPIYQGLLALIQKGQESMEPFSQP